MTTEQSTISAALVDCHCAIKLGVRRRSRLMQALVSGRKIIRKEGDAQSCLGPTVAIRAWSLRRLRKSFSANHSHPNRMPQALVLHERPRQHQCRAILHRDEDRACLRGWY